MRRRWLVIVLLLLSVGINYIDRGNLSIAAPAVSAQLSLRPDEMGLLLSAFFWTYALCQMLAGWLIDRYNVYWVYGAGFFLWSAATAATGLAGGFTAIFAMRLLLGIGESVAYPACSKIIASDFPEERRGLANSLVDVGGKGGPAVSTIIGALMIAAYGWRVFFLALGLGAMLWLIPWFAVAPRRTRRPAAHEAGPSILEIARTRAAWGTFLGLFCANYIWYFLLTWLPSYLIQERGLSLATMASLGSLPYWGIAASSVFCGWASDRWISRGASPNRVRKTFAASGLLLVNLILPAAFVSSAPLSLALLLAACLLFGMFSSNGWAITQTMAGPLAAGKWTGMQNMMGNFAGVVAPWVTGVILTRTHSFPLAFAAAGAMSALGAASYLWLVPRVAPIEWRRPAAPVTSTS